MSARLLYDYFFSKVLGNTVYIWTDCPILAEIKERLFYIQYVVAGDNTIRKTPRQESLVRGSITRRIAGRLMIHIYHKYMRTTSMMAMLK